MVNLFLAHGNVEWMMAGVVVFVGIMVFVFHIARGHIMHVMTSACVWVFVFTIHGGTITGSMTATLAALLWDVFGLPLFRLFRR
jgi:hypothetical protein